MSEQGQIYGDVDADEPPNPLEPTPEYRRLEFDIKGRTLDVVDGLHKAMSLNLRVDSEVIEAVPWEYQDAVEQELIGRNVHDFDDEILDFDEEVMEEQAEELAVLREAHVPEEKIAKDALNLVLIESIEELDQVYGLPFILLDSPPNFDDDHPDMERAVKV